MLLPPSSLAAIVFASGTTSRDTLEQPFQTADIRPARPGTAPAPLKGSRAATLSQGGSRGRDLLRGLVEAISEIRIRGRRPSRSETFGSKPSSLRARVMSG